MCKTNHIHIGTSGWCYGHWLGEFYPNDLNEKEYLKYYSENFCTVEINNSFYQIPTAKSVSHWVEAVPQNFVFSIKANRYITHMKKLAEPNKSLSKFLSALDFFGDKLGIVLFQLPPNFNLDIEKLKAFIKELPKEYRYVMEFRDKSWFNHSVYELMKENNIGFCIYKIGNFCSPKEITADFVYIRYHGPVDLGQGKYNREELIDFSNEIKGYIEQKKEIFAYFNNDQAGFAPQNAKELKSELLTYIN